MKEEILTKIYETNEKNIDNYDHYALLLNACDIAHKRYERAPYGIKISTIGNIPSEFLQGIEINKDLNKFKLMELYQSDIIKGVARDYVVTTISILDGLFEDIYEIILSNEGLNEVEIYKKVQFGEGALPFVLFNKIPSLEGRKNARGFELKDTFYTYEVLRQIRHALIHSKGNLQPRHLRKINSVEENIPDNQRITKSGIIKNGNEVNTDISTIYQIRHWVLTFLSFLLTDFEATL
jgi:hypothetical protein